jgi:hypothetical protein
MRGEKFFFLSFSLFLKLVLIRFSFEYLFKYPILGYFYQIKLNLFLFLTLQRFAFN